MNLISQTAIDTINKKICRPESYTYVHFYYKIKLKLNLKTILRCYF